MPIATGMITISSSPTLVCDDRHGRHSLTVESHGATTVYLGNNDVAVGTGIRLKGVDGASISVNEIQAALYGIADGTDQEVSFIEVYG